MRRLQTTRGLCLPPRLAPVLLVLAHVIACSDGTKTSEDTDDDLPPELLETCAADSECASSEICEDDTCVVGDRDNDFDEARNLRFEQTRQGTIAPAGDIDFFQFETLAPGQWVLLETETVRESSDDIDTVIRLYQSNGLEHAAMDNYDIYRITSADSSLVAYLPNAGEWFVSVEDISTYYELSPTRGGTDFSYSLTLSSFDAVTSEVGNPLLVDLESGSRISRRGVLIDTEGDSDELIVRSPYEGTLLHVSGGRNTPGSSLTPDVTFSANGEIVMRQQALGSDTYGHVFRSLADDYVVTVTDAQGLGGPAFWTVLYFRTFEPDSDVTFWGEAIYQQETEPNDDSVTAEPVIRSQETTDSGLVWNGGFIEGTIDGEGDEDWFSVDIAAGQNTTVRCYAERFGSTVDLAVQLLDADLTEVTTATDNPPWSAPHVYNVEGATTRYLRVYAEDDMWGPAAFYRCQLIESEWTVAQ